jgi:hypothetical protein
MTLGTTIKNAMLSITSLSITALETVRLSITNEPILLRANVLRVLIQNVIMLNMVIETLPRQRLKVESKFPLRLNLIFPPFLKVIKNRSP